MFEIRLIVKGFIIYFYVIIFAVFLWQDMNMYVVLSAFAPGPTLLLA